MTVLAPTSGGTTARGAWRRNRAAISVVAALVAVLVLLVLVAGSGRGGALDPDSYTPAGAHALAVLLTDRSVDVQRTTDIPGTADRARDRSRSTVFVPLPDQLSDEEISVLAGLPGPLVVAGADSRVLAALGAQADVMDVAKPADRDPRCQLPSARNAGKATVGGFSYRASVTGAHGCYPAGDGRALLDLPEQELVLVGSGDLFTNEHLGDEGNAALGLSLLGQGDAVVWLMPSPTRAELGKPPIGGLNDLLPSWVRVGVVQLFVVLVVLALWRARRLGRVVVEPLPVIVRAAETVEGRGRLYRAAGARDTAAEALRSGARDQLARRLTGSREDATLPALTAERSGRTPGEVQALLYGPPPASDADLVRLADDLDTLIREVAGS